MLSKGVESCQCSLTGHWISRPVRRIEFYTKVCNMTNRYKDCNWDVFKLFNAEADTEFSIVEGAYSEIDHANFKGELRTSKQWLALKMRVHCGISIVLLLTSSYKAFSGYGLWRGPKCDFDIFSKKSGKFWSVRGGTGASPRSTNETPLESSSTSKISHSGAPTLSLGLKPIIWQDFLENCMKMKEIASREL